MNVQESNSSLPSSEVPNIYLLCHPVKSIQLYLRLPHLRYHYSLRHSPWQQTQFRGAIISCTETASCCAFGLHDPSLLMLLIFLLIHAAAEGKPTPDVHPLICSYGIWAPTPLSSVSFQDQVCLISASRRNSYFSPRQILKNSKFTFSLNKGKRLKN